MVPRGTRYGLSIAAASVVYQLALPVSAADERMKAYDEVRAKTIFELQPFRRAVEMQIDDGRSIRLIHLNERIGDWAMLEIIDGSGRSTAMYHLQNSDPGALRLSLDANAGELTISGGERTTRCKPWTGTPSALAEASEREVPYVPICDGALFVRNQVAGAQTNLEATTDFLRDNIWGGESVIRFVKSNFYQDAEFTTSEGVAVDADGRPTTGPRPMQAVEIDGKRQTIAVEMGLNLVDVDQSQMPVGFWYPIEGLQGAYASAFQPRMIAEEVLNGPGVANRLDAIEARANGFMVAFDLSRYDVGYAVGTDHPSLEWSPRPPASVRPRGLPGPDGIKSARPLVTVGIVPPSIAGDVRATFTGGFKRRHGAFKYGDYATVDFGRHYGFIESGVIFSKLQPGLSTLYVLDDGTMDMKTWERGDDAMLPRIRFARQNGVPLIETNPATGEGIPGALVTRWGPGNWSGSAKAELRALRSGACVQDHGGTRYLIYGYFSTATPSAMARAFQAYGCRYAMHLDMNALEHTYMAAYPRADGEVGVKHLIAGMSVLDKEVDGAVAPRFLGFADNRDFFYLTERRN